METCTCVTIASMRQTYALGCTPNPIQVLVVTQDGPWYRGVLLGVDGFIADVELHGDDGPTFLGTLWPDRLARTAMGLVQRDPVGRPLIRLSKVAGVLQLIETQGGNHPCFSVVDAAARPETIEEWLRMPATCEHR